MKISRIFSKPILLAVLGVLPAANASADILISESFSGSYAEGSLNGQAASGTGLSGNWAAFITGTTGNAHGASYTSSGLSFGTFATSGGAMTLTLDATQAGSGAATNFIIVGADTNTFGTVTGTLYSSFIYQTAGYIAASHTINQRIGSTSSGNFAAGRFSLNSDNSGTNTLAGTNYSGSSGTTVGGSTPVDATTYITIGRFTNVGVAGGGTANMVTLDIDQYNDWIADGGTEALLFARTQGTTVQDARVNISHSNSNTANFIGGNSAFLQASTNLGTASGTFSTTFDEFKYATTFNEVVQAAPAPIVPVLQIQTVGEELVFNWASTTGYTYALLSDDDLDPAPSLWPVVGANTGIVATPPTNTLQIPRPALPRNFYTLKVTPAP